MTCTALGRLGELCRHVESTLAVSEVCARLCDTDTDCDWELMTAKSHSAYRTFPKVNIVEVQMGPRLQSASKRAGTRVEQAWLTLIDS